MNLQGLSHNVKNLLAGIEGFVGILEDHLGAAAEFQDLSPPPQADNAILPTGLCFQPPFRPGRHIMAIEKNAAPGRYLQT
jgi:hypothetical protein